MKYIYLIVCCVWAQSFFATEIRAEYLLWIIKSNPVPTPLVTTASFADPVPGALGQPGSHVKMGDTQINMGWQSGFQVTASSWIDCESKYGIEGSYFLLPKVTKKRELTTSGQVGSPNYAVPIFDVTGFWGLNGIPGETVYLLPGPLFGTPGFEGLFQLKVASTLQGAQLNGLFNCCYFDALAGLRWIFLHESLRFNVQTKSIPGNPEPPSFFNSRDQFKTTNNFLGAQIGLQARLGKCSWHLDGAVKGGLGAVLENVNIKGSSVSPGGNLFYLIIASTPQHIPGGIFAQPTNIGSHNGVRFGGILEAIVRASYAFNRCFEVNAGYDFLWISRVARPGNQIDRKINPTLTGLGAASRATAGTSTSPTPFGMPGPAQAPQGPKRPRFALERSDFWAQGFTIGLDFRF